MGELSQWWSVTMSGGPVSRSHVMCHPIPHLDNPVVLHLPSEYVAHTDSSNNCQQQMLHLISQSDILRRTCIIMGLWWCGCMRLTINQARIPELHQRNSWAPWSSSVHHPSHQTLKMQKSPFAVGSPKLDFASKWNWVTIRDWNRESQSPSSKVQKLCWILWFIGLEVREKLPKNNAIQVGFVYNCENKHLKAKLGILTSKSSLIVSCPGLNSPNSRGHNVLDRTEIPNE